MEYENYTQLLVNALWTCFKAYVEQDYEAAVKSAEFINSLLIPPVREMVFNFREELHRRQHDPSYLPLSQTDLADPARRAAKLRQRADAIIDQLVPEFIQQVIDVLYRSGILKGVIIPTSELKAPPRPPGEGAEDAE